MAPGSTGLVVAAALAAGVAGAAAAVMLTGSPSPAPPSAARDGRVAELEERVARQEEEIRELRARLDEAAAAATVRPQRAPEGRPGPGPSAAVSAEGESAAAPASPESPGVPSEEPGAAPGAPGLPRPEGVPADANRFRTLYRAEREKEQEEARKALVAAEEARIRARLDRAQELGLTSDQKDAVVKILLDRSQRTRQAFEEARASGTPDAFAGAREKTSAVRQETRQALEAILTPEQLQVVDPAGRADRQGGRLGGIPGGEGGAGRRRRDAGGGAGGQPPR